MPATKHRPDAAERIEEYIDSLPAWSAGICTKLRKLVLATDPQIIEDWKWGPNYYLGGMVCGYAAFKHHVYFVFFKGVLLADKKKLLIANKNTQITRHMQFKDLKEVEKCQDLLVEYILEAIDINRKGKKPLLPKDRKVEIAPDVRRAFKAAGLLKYFEGLAYSHKKEYMLYIEEAKKAETRLKRIEKAISKLGSREMMHDKYKKMILLRCTALKNNNFDPKL